MIASSRDSVPLADVIHRHDCSVFAQLNFAGSRVDRECAEPVGPSPVVNPSTGLLARELKSSEILDIVNAFGQAAGRVREAGLDGILIHSGHGYLGEPLQFSTDQPEDR